MKTRSHVASRILDALGGVDAGPGQAKAITAHVWLSNGAALSGALALHAYKDGGPPTGLKMMSPVQGPAGRIMLEQFFEMDDVVVFALEVAITADAPRIISS